MQEEGKKLYNGSEREKGEGYQIYERKIKGFDFYLMINIFCIKIHCDHGLKQFF